MNDLCRKVCQKHSFELDIPSLDTDLGCDNDLADAALESYSNQTPGLTPCQTAAGGTRFDSQSAKCNDGNIIYGHIHHLCLCWPCMRHLRPAVCTS